MVSESCHQWMLRGPSIQEYRLLEAPSGNAKRTNFCGHVTLSCVWKQLLFYPNCALNADFVAVAETHQRGHVVFLPSLNKSGRIGLIKELQRVRTPLEFVHAWLPKGLLSAEARHGDAWSAYDQGALDVVLWRNPQCWAECANVKFDIYALMHDENLNEGEMRNDGKI